VLISVNNANFLFCQTRSIIIKQVRKKQTIYKKHSIRIIRFTEKWSNAIFYATNHTIEKLAQFGTLGIGKTRSTQDGLVTKCKMLCGEKMNCVSLFSSATQ